CSTGLEVGFNMIAIDFGNVLVRQENHDDVGRFDGVGNFLHLEAGFFGLAPRSTALAQANRDVDARPMQLERMRMALRTGADNGTVSPLIRDRSQSLS